MPGQPIASSVPASYSYKSTITMDFPTAMRAIIEGRSITKLEWDNPASHAKLRDGKLMIFLDPEWHTWIVTDGDLLSQDWVVLQDS